MLNNNLRLAVAVMLVPAGPLSVAVMPAKCLLKLGEATLWAGLSSARTCNLNQLAACRRGISCGAVGGVNVVVADSLAWKERCVRRWPENKSHPRGTVCTCHLPSVASLANL